MITIGIDSVDIERFNHWTSFSHKKLSRLYSQKEIAYSLSQQNKAAERLAVRFAVKEAFYKAVATLLPEPTPFITIGKQCTVSYGNRGNPELTIHWSALQLPEYTAQVSLTHTKTTATAIVTIESSLKAPRYERALHQP